MIDDIYRNLINALSNWQTTNAKIRERNRQVVKQIAEELREKSTCPEQTLDAAFCYYIAGYYVHAQTLSNINNLVDANKIQKWIFWFMAKRFPDLKAETFDVVTDVGTHDTTIRDEIDAGNLGRSAVVNRIVEVKVAESFLDILSFIETGDNNKYHCAVDTLSKCQKLLFKDRDWKIWWWVEVLKMISQEFVESSLWRVLQPMRDNPINSDMVSKYVAANYEKLKIVEFWRTQIESLPNINDPERCSFCISVPTSAGKTKAAELAVLRFLLDYWNEPDKKCVYIAPLRTLCQEVEEAFSKVFDQFQKHIVSMFYGGYEIDIFDQYLWKKTRILIMTPQKLDGMLRQHPELKSQIQLVIADEGHLIGEQDPTYRFLLERLIYLFKKRSTTETKAPRIILISGVLPKPENIAELILGSRDKLIKIDWRPVEEPKIYIWMWNGQWDSKIFDGKTWQADIRPIPEQINDCKGQSTFEEQVAKISVSAAKQNGVIVFSAKKKPIKNLVPLLKCIAHHSPLGHFDGVNPSIKQNHSDYSLLLENGMSIHHADLPLEIKREIKGRIDVGKVRLLFASPTLAQGVNMPFDTVLIYDLYHYDIDYDKLPVSDPVFWNVVGRVGRPVNQQLKTRAKLEAPKVVFLLNQAPSTKEEKKNSRLNSRRFNDLVINRGRYLVASPFLGFIGEVRKLLPTINIAQLASQLAEKPKLNDVLGQSATSYKWENLTLEQCLIELDRHLVSILAESDVDKASEWLQQSIDDLVALFVKASVIKDNDIEIIKQVVTARLKFIAKYISKEKQRQEYLLGLPYEDCETIKQNENELLAWYQGCIGLFNNNRESGTQNLVNLMQFVASLSICAKKKKSRNKSKRLVQTSFVLTELFISWINGKSTDELLSTNEEFTKYRDLEKTLPWGISAIVRYLNAITKERELPIYPDLEYIPSLVKYGLNSKVACHLMRLHIRRKFATHIADAYSTILSKDECDEFGEPFKSDFMNAIKSLQTLTSDEINRLEIDKRTVERIQKILEKFPIVDNNIEPEFPPFDEMEFYD